MTFVNDEIEGFVSVHLPVRNGEKYLSVALDSILSQTMQDYEVVAVDHGSTDDTGNILAEYASRDERVRHLSFAGKNFVDALNFGLSNCAGEFIARMDADDYSAPSRLEKQSAFLRCNHDVDFVGSEVEIFAEGGVKGGYERYEEWINSLHTHEEIRREMFVESPLPNPSVMGRRSAYEVLGGYADFGWPEDYDLYLRGIDAGMAMAKVPEKLLRWRDHPERSTRNLSRYSRKNFLKVRAFYLAKMLGERGTVMQGAGTTGKVLGKFLLEFGANLKGFVDINPRREGKEKLGLPVYAAKGLERFKGDVMLSAVSSWGARDEIRGLVLEAGFIEGVDFYCCS